MACSRMSCSFCRRAEDPLDGGVSAPPLALAVVDFCVLGVSVAVVGMDVGGPEAAVAVGGEEVESSFLGDFVLMVGN